MKKKKAVMHWSGGKDSAHALWRALQEDEYEFVALLTTTNRDTQLSTMHNIPLQLLKAQSESIGIPLHIVELMPNGNMADYTTKMEEIAHTFQQQGVTHFIFGDIYLNDIRKYREDVFHPLGIKVVEPLWGPSSAEIMETYLQTGLQTVVVTTQDTGLGMDSIGKIIDRDFIENLPKWCDPNGENGEYHTFCFDGPLFCHPISFTLGNPIKQSYDIRLEDGTTQTYTYCFAQLQEI